MKARSEPVLDALRDAVLGPSGRSHVADRRRAYAGGQVSDAVDGYLALVRDASFRITDEHVATVRAAGYDEDAIFELTVAAALGTARERFQEAMRAVQAFR